MLSRGGFCGLDETRHVFVRVAEKIPDCNSINYFRLE